MFVFDATPLIYLTKAGKLEDLRELDEEKAIPDKVYEEVVGKGKRKGKPDAEKIEKAVEKEVFNVVTTEVEESSENLSEADLGVLEAAEERNATAVMDEEYGRNMAEARDIQTRGTAYTVLKMQKQGTLTREEAENTIDKMIDKGWYCSTSLYKDIRSKIKEIG